MSRSTETLDILEFTHRMRFIILSQQNLIVLLFLFRQNRVYMIQTADQYVFLYRALIEGILTEQTSISLKEFMITRKVHMDIKDQYKVTFSVCQFNQLIFSFSHYLVIRTVAIEYSIFIS